MLNAISRRGILKTVVTGLLVAKYSALTFLWGDTPTPILIHHVLALTRQLNTCAAAIVNKTGNYPDLPTLLGPNDGLMSHKGHFKPGTYAYEWMSRVNFFSDEILPGWVIDYQLKPGNTGYILILTGTKGKYRSVVITDEVGGIYRSMPLKTDKVPAAKELTRAQDYPGAEGIDKFQEPLSESITRFFTPTVEARICPVGSRQPRESQQEQGPAPRPPWA